MEPKLLNANFVDRVTMDLNFSGNRLLQGNDTHQMDLRQFFDNIPDPIVRRRAPPPASTVPVAASAKNLDTFLTWLLQRCKRTTCNCTVFKEQTCTDFDAGLFKKHGLHKRKDLTVQALKQQLMSFNDDVIASKHHACVMDLFAKEFQMNIIVLSKDEKQEWQRSNFKAAGDVDACVLVVRKDDGGIRMQECNAANVAQHVAKTIGIDASNLAAHKVDGLKSVCRLLGLPTSNVKKADMCKSIQGAL